MRRTIAGQLGQDVLIAGFIHSIMLADVAYVVQCTRARDIPACAATVCAVLQTWPTLSCVRVMRARTTCSHCWHRQTQTRQQHRHRRQQQQQRQRLLLQVQPAVASVSSSRLQWLVMAAAVLLNSSCGHNCRWATVSRTGFSSYKCCHNTLVPALNDKLWSAAEMCVGHLVQ